MKTKDPVQGALLAKENFSSGTRVNFWTTGLQLAWLQANLSKKWSQVQRTPVRLWKLRTDLLSPGHLITSNMSSPRFLGY